MVCPWLRFLVTYLTLATAISGASAGAGQATHNKERLTTQEQARHLNGHAVCQQQQHTKREDVQGSTGPRQDQRPEHDHRQLLIDGASHQDGPDSSPEQAWPLHIAIGINALPVYGYGYAAAGRYGTTSHGSYGSAQPIAGTTTHAAHTSQPPPSPSPAISPQLPREHANRQTRRAEVHDDGGADPAPTSRPPPPSLASLRRPWLPPPSASAASAPQQPSEDHYFPPGEAEAPPSPPRRPRPPRRPPSPPHAPSTPSPPPPSPDRQVVSGTVTTVFYLTALKAGGAIQLNASGSAALLRKAALITGLPADAMAITAADGTEAATLASVQQQQQQQQRQQQGEEGEGEGDGDAQGRSLQEVQLAPMLRMWVSAELAAARGTRADLVAARMREALAGGLFNDLFLARNMVLLTGRVLLLAYLEPGGPVTVTGPPAPQVVLPPWDPPPAAGAAAAGGSVVGPASAAARAAGPAPAGKGIAGSVGITIAVAVVAGVVALAVLAVVAVALGHCRSSSRRRRRQHNLGSATVADSWLSRCASGISMQPAPGSGSGSSGSGSSSSDCSPSWCLKRYGRGGGGGGGSSAGAASSGGATASSEGQEAADSDASSQAAASAAGVSRRAAAGSALSSSNRVRGTHVIAAAGPAGPSGGAQPRPKTLYRSGGRSGRLVQSGGTVAIQLGPATAAAAAAPGPRTGGTALSAAVLQAAEQAAVAVARSAPSEGRTSMPVNVIKALATAAATDRPLLRRPAAPTPNPDADAEAASPLHTVVSLPSALEFAAAAAAAPGVSCCSSSSRRARRTTTDALWAAPAAILSRALGALPAGMMTGLQHASTLPAPPQAAAAGPQAAAAARPSRRATVDTLGPLRRMMVQQRQPPAPAPGLQAASCSSPWPWPYPSREGEAAAHDALAASRSSSIEGRGGLAVDCDDVEALAAAGVGPCVAGGGATGPRDGRAARRATTTDMWLRALPSRALAAAAGPSLGAGAPIRSVIGPVPEADEGNAAGHESSSGSDGACVRVAPAPSVAMAAALLPAASAAGIVGGRRFLRRATVDVMSTLPDP